MLASISNWLCKPVYHCSVTIYCSLSSIVIVYWMRIQVIGHCCLVARVYRATINVWIVNQEGESSKKTFSITYMKTNRTPEIESKATKTRWFKEWFQQKARASVRFFEKHNKAALPLPLMCLALCQPWAELRSPFREQLIQPGQESVEYSGRAPLYAVIYALSVSSYYYMEVNTAWLEAWETQSTSLWEKRLMLETPPGRDINYLDTH